MTEENEDRNDEQIKAEIAALQAQLANKQAGGVSTAKIAVGVLIGALVAWFVVSTVTDMQNDNKRYDCLTENVDRSFTGVATRDCESLYPD